jgi:hypothetical protein
LNDPKGEQIIDWLKELSILVDDRENTVKVFVAHANYTRTNDADEASETNITLNVRDHEEQIIS